MATPIYLSGAALLFGSILVLAGRASAAPSFLGLGHLPGGVSSSAGGVSADGSVVVGGSDGQAFRWTEAGGMVGLGDIPGGLVQSSGAAVSGDGSAVVGFGTSAASIQGFR